MSGSTTAANESLPSVGLSGAVGHINAVAPMIASMTPATSSAKILSEPGAQASKPSGTPSPAAISLYAATQARASPPL
jgi:hypothetical protein